jgi:TusA-related sulfurtransferase
MVTKRLDVRGEICPDPLTHTLAAMRNLAVGDRLEVIVDSPLALETISRWVQNNHHKLVAVTEVGAGQWQITIEKSA